MFPLFSWILQRKELYLSNHSLGRPLDRTERAVAEFMDLWYRDMDGAWDAWMGPMNHSPAIMLGGAAWHA